MIVNIICADCGKEITPFNTCSLVPNEIKIEISTCTCRVVTCEDCEDLEILHKEVDVLGKKLKVSEKTKDELQVQLAAHEALP